MPAAAASLAQIIHDHVTDEEWRDVPGYEGFYMASSHGRVKSLDRVVFHGTYTKMGKPVYRQQPGKLMPGYPTKRGYLSASLCREGVSWTVTIHRVVALTFLGPVPDGLEVCHNDGNPANNRPENLRYDTHKENNADKHLHGTQLQGTTITQSKLTEFEVLYLRYLHGKGGIPDRESTALQYGVHAATIQKILSGKTWKHLPLEPTRLQVHEAFNVDVGWV